MLIHGDGHLIYIQDPMVAEKAGKPGDEANGDIHVGVSTCSYKVSLKTKPRCHVPDSGVRILDVVVSGPTPSSL